MNLFRNGVCGNVFLNFDSYSVPLASCVINAQPLPAHRPATDDDSLIGCTGQDLTDDWSLPMPIPLTAYAHFTARLGAFFYGTRLF